MSGQQSTFMPPSGDINCIYTAKGGTGVYMPLGGGPEVVCDRSADRVYQRAYLGPKGPAENVRRPGDASGCSVEPLLLEDARLRRGPYSCELTRGEVVCRRDDGHGFAIGGSRVRLFRP